jgi:uncharacterized small protein (TIGR04563 family)
MSDGRDRRKQSLYFPESMITEIHREAARLDRSISWVVQRCVRVGLQEVKRMPSTTDPVVEG